MRFAKVYGFLNISAGLELSTPKVLSPLSSAFFAQMPVGLHPTETFHF
jgi:hypothetical protein